MKLNKIIKLATVSALLLGGALSVNAESVYYSDFQGSYINVSGSAVVGNFAVSVNKPIDTGAIIVTFYNASTSPITFFGSPQFRIGTSSPVTSSIAVAVLTTCNGQAIAPNSALTCSGTVSGSNGNTQYAPGNTYWVEVDDPQTSDPGLKLISDGTRTLFYGSITDGQGSEVPWIPGISQIGAATSTVATFCNQNFATTTGGFLAGIGQDISLGLCKVTAFLFIPNQNAVQSFYNNMDNLKTRFPFAWVVDAREIYNTYVATTTDNFFDITINLATSGPMLGLPPEVPLLNKTIITSFMSDNMRNAFKTLLATVFYLLAAAFIYRDIQRVWHKQS